MSLVSNETLATWLVCVVGADPVRLERALGPLARDAGSIDAIAEIQAESGDEAEVRQTSEENVTWSDVDCGSLEELAQPNPEEPLLPAPEAQPSPISDLPTEMIEAIIEQVASQADAVSAFYDLHHLVATNRAIRSIGLASIARLRKRYGNLAEKTAGQRRANAEADVRSPESSITADEVIANHGLTDADAAKWVRRIAASRDIEYGGLLAGAAIARHGVTHPEDVNVLCRAGAVRDIYGGTPAPDAIAGHGVTDWNDDRAVRRLAVERDLSKGAPAPDLLARHGVTVEGDVIDLSKKAALRDAKTGMRASQAIERNGIVWPASITDVRRKSAEWDIGKGSAAPDAVKKHGITSTSDDYMFRFKAAEQDIKGKRMAPDQAIKRHKVVRPSDLAALRVMKK